jgi:hypothetical protein
MSRVLPSSVRKKRPGGVGVAVRTRERSGVAGVVAEVSSVVIVGLAIAAVASELGAVVSGNGIVASGGGVETRVAPAMSAVVRVAKWPAVSPPVRQRT